MGHRGPTAGGRDTRPRTGGGDGRGGGGPARADGDPDTVVQFVRVGCGRSDGFDPAATDEADGPNGSEDLLAYYAHP